MDNGGGNGGGSFKVKHWSNAAEVTDVHEAGAGEVEDVVGERETRIESNTKIMEVKEVEDELSERCIEGSGIFMIWAGRPVMMNSVSEGLRRRRLDDIH